MHGGIADDLSTPAAAAPPPPASLAPTLPSVALSSAASETASLEGAGSVQSLELRHAASVKSFDLDEDRPQPPPVQQPTPQSAASLMADAVQLGVGDRYSSIAGDNVSSALPTSSHPFLTYLMASVQYLTRNS